MCGNDESCWAKSSSEGVRTHSDNVEGPKHAGRYIYAHIYYNIRYTHKIDRINLINIIRIDRS